MRFCLIFQGKHGGIYFEVESTLIPSSSSTIDAVGAKTNMVPSINA